MRTAVYVRVSTARQAQAQTIEAKMRCIKLLGERLSARTSSRQTAELQIRAALLNRFTSLGTPETVRVA